MASIDSFGNTNSAGIGDTASHVEDMTSETITVDSTSAEAFVVRKNDNGDAVLTVNTSDSKVNILGDLTVQGNSSFTSTANFEVSDNLIELASGNGAGDSLDFGIYGTYLDSTAKYSGLFRDASDSGIWKFVKGLATAPGTGSNFQADVSSNLASIQCDEIKGTIATASQPNITSLGTLSTLTTSGVISSGAYNTAGTGYAFYTKNANGLLFSGDGWNHATNVTFNQANPNATAEFQLDFNLNEDGEPPTNTNFANRLSTRYDGLTGLNNYALAVDNSGKVGVGTASPQASLQVGVIAGGIDSTASTEKIIVNNWTYGNDTNLNDPVTVFQAYRPGSNSHGPSCGIALCSAGGGHSYGRMDLQVSYDHIGYPVLYNPMTLLYNKIGINNGAPSEALDVTGNAEISGTIKVGSATAVNYIESGTWTSTIADTVDFSSTPTQAYANYTRIGDIVNFSLVVNFNFDASVSGAQFSFTLPYKTGNFSASNKLIASGNLNLNPFTATPKGSHWVSVSSSPSASTKCFVTISFETPANYNSVGGSCFIHGQYNYTV